MFLLFLNSLCRRNNGLFPWQPRVFLRRSPPTGWHDDDGIIWARHQGGKLFDLSAVSCLLSLFLYIKMCSNFNDKRMKRSNLVNHCTYCDILEYLDFCYLKLPLKFWCLSCTFTHLHAFEIGALKTKQEFHQNSVISLKFHWVLYF